jgi:hypothetical protein
MNKNNMNHNRTLTYHLKKYRSEVLVPVKISMLIFWVVNVKPP